MNTAFIAAVVDTLLPGDSGGPDGYPPLPPASAAGVDLRALKEKHLAVFEGIARQVDDPGAFISGTDAARVAAIQAVERAMPDAFRAMLLALLADYYESAPVLSAMRWRTDPPQPLGHDLTVNDSRISEQMERVRARSKLWRD